MAHSIKIIYCDHDYYINRSTSDISAFKNIIHTNHPTPFNSFSFVTHTFPFQLPSYFLSKLILSGKGYDNVMKIIPHKTLKNLIFHEPPL